MMIIKRISRANLFHSGKANLIIMTGQEISVNIPPTLDPVYSNMIQIAYKDDEFTFMFLHQPPAGEPGTGKGDCLYYTSPCKKSARCFDKDRR